MYGRERKEKIFMRNLYQSRFASVLTVLLGVWVMLSPAFISITGAALANVLIVGGVMVLAGLIQLFWKNSVPSWVTGLAAVWLFISAFAFTVSNAVAWNEAISAIIAFVLATWDGVEMSEFQNRHHAGTA